MKQPHFFKWIQSIQRSQQGRINMKFTCIILFIFGCMTLLAQEDKNEAWKRQQENEKFRQSLLVELRNGQAPEDGYTFKPDKIKEYAERTLSDGRKENWMHQYHQSMIVGGTRIIKTTMPDGSVHYNGVYYRIPPDLDCVPIHSAEEIERFMLPLAKFWFNHYPDRIGVTPKLSPYDNFSPFWIAQAGGLAITISDATLEITGYRNYSADGNLRNANVIRKYLGKRIHEIIPEEEDRKTPRPIKKKPEGSQKEQVKQQAKLETQQLNDDFGQGMGWDAPRIDFPILRSENQFFFYAFMRNNEYKIATFDFAKIPVFYDPLAEECIDDSMANGDVAKTPCLLLGVDQTTILRWLFKNEQINQTDWGTSARSAVDAQSHFWEIKKWLLQSNQFDFPWLNKWILSVIDVPGADTGYWYQADDGVYNVSIGDIFNFQNGNCHWARSREVSGHEFAHWINGQAVHIQDQENGTSPNLWPKAIDEGIADILGSIFATYAGPNNENQNFWIYGEAFPNSCHPTRHMDNPQLNAPVVDGNKTLTYAVHYADRTIEEMPTGHFNGSIIPLAYALLVKGGSHPQANVYPGPTLSGTMDKLQAARIFYKALITFNTQFPTIFDLRQQTLDVLPSLGLSAYADRLKLAWDAVGVYESAPTTLKVNITASITPTTPQAGDLYRFELLKEDWYSGSLAEGALYEDGFLELRFKASGGQGTWEIREVAPAFGDPPAGNTFTDTLIYVHTPIIAHWYVNLKTLDPVTRLDVSVRLRPWEQYVFNLPQYHVVGNHKTQKVFKVPPSAPGQRSIDLLRFSTAGGSGNVDIYGKRGSVPTLTDYDVAATGTGNDHVLEVDRSGEEPWYFLAYGAEDYSEVTMLLENSECDFIGAAANWLHPQMCNPNGSQSITTNVGDLLKFKLAGCNCQ